jgi:hypothetical protein
MKSTNDKFEDLIKSLQDDINEVDLRKDEESYYKSTTLRAILACVMEMQKIYNEDTYGIS